jgi:alkane 1-monooxygenase
LQCLVIFLFQVAGAIMYLEIINYIEHYGLKRKKLSNGEYEKVNIKHSWNAPHRFSNYLLFKLQRHSDHH